jgi:hypothetical protein
MYWHQLGLDAAEYAEVNGVAKLIALKSEEDKANTPMIVTRHDSRELLV